jgi:hypothetical protein
MLVKLRTEKFKNTLYILIPIGTEWARDLHLEAHDKNEGYVCVYVCIYVRACL